jgi:quercetin dioxygenase-like cupin family protein
MPMPANPIRSDTMRRSETPNAVMTTVASPTQGPTFQLSLWRVAMNSGQQGPRHVFDREQVWHVLAGEIEIEVSDEPVRLRPGDALVLPAGVARQVTAVSDTEIVVSGLSDAIVTAPGQDAPRGTPPWIS